MNRGLRLGPAVPIGLIWGAALLAAAYVAFAFALVSSHGHNWPDFTWYYVAGQIAGGGQAHQLYDFALQQRLESQLTGIPAGHLLFLPYLNPPVLALLVAPLTRLPFAGAYLAFVGVSVVAVAAALWVAAGEAGLRGRSRVAGWAVALTAYPTFVTLARGQVDGFVLLGVVLAWVGWRRGRPGWAGAALAIALLKFNVVLVLPLFLLARRSGRGVLGLAAAVLVAAAISTAWFGPGIWVHYVHAILPAAAGGIGQEVHGLKGVDYGVLGITAALGLPRSVGFAASVAVVLGFLALAAGRRGGSRHAFPLAVVVSLLVAPYEGVQDLILLLVPMLALAGEVSRGRLPVTGWLAVAAAWTAGMLPFLVPVLVPVLMLGLAGFLGWALWQQPFRGEVDEQHLQAGGRDEWAEEGRVGA